MSAADSAAAPSPLAARRALAGLTVWVVEDDAELRALMLDDLRWRGAVVVGLDSAEALYRELAVARCDIVILDVGLPGEDGYRVAEHLRRAASMGIVMLTGRGSSHEMAHGLALGADLYLVKPLDVELLAAALGSLRRRLFGDAEPVTSEAVATATLASPRWALRDDGWSLTYGQGPALELTTAERGFLRALMAEPATPVDRETLIAAVTDQPWDFDPHRLDVLVHRLRTRVSNGLGARLPVRAVRGVGYIFAVNDAG